MKMARIKKCDVSECAYNQDNQCHTMAITVGDDVHPQCDTFCACGAKGGMPSAVAGVGACKVSACKFNQSLECSSPSVMIGHRQNEVDCLTFEPR